MNRKEFVFSLVITFIVIMIWIGYDVFYKTKASVDIDPKLESILEPLNSNFDQKTLDLVNSFSEPPSLSQSIQTPSPAETPTPTPHALQTPAPTPIPLPTLNPLPTQSSTSSAPLLSQ